MIKKLAAALGIVVFFVLAGTAAGYAYWSASVSTTGSVQVADLAAMNCANPVSLVNGDFETPVIANNNWSHPGSTGVAPWVTVRPGTQTATSPEIWRGNVTGSITPASGAQNIEINGTEAATFYQNVSTAPGQVLEWGFWHRGRDSASNPDKVQLTIGPSTANGAGVQGGTTSNTNPTTLVNDGTRLVIVFPTTNTAWKYYSGTYTVPAGQTTTRISFTSHTQGGGNASQGNLIDGVTFGSGPCLNLGSAIARVGGTQFEPGTTARVTTTITNVGGRTAGSSVLTLPLPTTLGTPSNIQINGAAAGVQSTTAGGMLTVRIGTGANGSVGGSIAGGGVVTVTYDATITGALGQTIATTPTVSYGDTANPGIVMTRTGSTVSVTIVDTTPPVAPGQPTVTPTGTTSMNISWAASSSPDLHHYEVQRVSSTGTWATVANNVTGTSWTDTGVTAGQAYAYRIVAKDAAGNASTSAVGTGLTHFGSSQYRIAWMNGTTAVCVDVENGELRNVPSCAGAAPNTQRWTFSATTGDTRVVSVSNTSQVWLQDYACTFVIFCGYSAAVDVATPSGSDYADWTPEAYYDSTSGNAFVRFKNAGSGSYLGATNANANAQLNVSQTTRNFVLTAL
ncbi:fibronectin type III domain-containing protein [Protaetiibacter sp. SSC-01]|uniref:fibronectin type III domain-containing protein n=1 Tax=Protaetiibacter sp. SSC-01 TaxID=2759943 RepID=UPI001656C2AA|nr:fibronectin type III domain-containing protein [Protaetiibacter sp. SSC-01]QNO36773.1 fibronectin type III domain-containing protein [Protaetiibacter sp. SSC-01]